MLPNMDENSVVGSLMLGLRQRALSCLYGPMDETEGTVVEGHHDRPWGKCGQAVFRKRVVGCTV
jgi:hypothetical protein